MILCTIVVGVPLVLVLFACSLCTIAYAPLPASPCSRNRLCCSASCGSPVLRVRDCSQRVVAPALPHLPSLSPLLCLLYHGRAIGHSCSTEDVLLPDRHNVYVFFIPHCLPRRGIPVGDV